MKRNILCIIMAILVISTNITIVKGQSMEEGNFTGTYSIDRITLSNGNIVNLEKDPTLLFLNGNLAIDYEMIIRDQRALVPARLISKDLGGIVSWDGVNREVTITKDEKKIVLEIDSKIAFVNGKEMELDYPAIIYKDSTYVPLRFLAENLDAKVNYSPSLSPEYTYYYNTKMPVSPAKTIIREFGNIIVDKKYDFSDSMTPEEAMKKTQEICLEGLENFSETMRENLLDSNENPNKFENEFKSIEKEINRMLYIGEVSRFYKFTIGPYDILFDRINHKVYFLVYSSNTILREVDVNDPDLYLSIFIVG